jgi:hypothetical protein
MHGSRRAPVRRGRAPRGRVLAVAIAASVGFGAVFVIALYAVAAVTHGASVSADPGTHSSTPNPHSSTPGAPSSTPSPRSSKPSPRSTPRARSSTQDTHSSNQPMAADSYAGSLLLDDTGAGLASWQSPSTCTASGFTPDADVTTDSAGDILLTTTGQENSCAALVSPSEYSSAVIEAEIDLPADPGQSGTAANWNSLWLTNAANWPEDGELDAVETDAPSGENGVTWHSGTIASNNTSSFTRSTRDGNLPIDGPNLTPGWHTIDIVYTKGFFAVYYDGSLYTSFSSSNVTGDPLAFYLTTDVYTQASNADASPATLKLRYLKIWAYQ